MNTLNNDGLIDCPICKGEKTVMVESTEGSSIENYLCVRCGYTTTSDMTIGSNYVETAKKVSPKLVVDLSVADNVRNLVWFPSVINIAEKGICYPDGTPKEWKWVVAPYKLLTKEETESYLSKDESTEYKWRLAIEKSVKFDSTDFQNALAFLGALVEKYNA